MKSKEEMIDLVHPGRIKYNKTGRRPIKKIQRFLTMGRLTPLVMVAENGDILIKNTVHKDNFSRVKRGDSIGRDLNFGAYFILEAKHEN